MAEDDSFISPPEKGEEWKKIGIYDMILLSKKEIPPNFELLYSFLSFWSVSANTFYLLFGIISPMLLNVVTIVGLPVDGGEVPYLHDVLGTDLGFKVNNKNNVYSTFINTFNKGNNLVGDLEHKAFLLFWIYRFFICTSSVAVVVEFAPYVLAILNQSYLNIRALFLSLLYKGIFVIMFRMKKRESIKSMLGPF